MKPGPKPRPLEERFWAKVDKHGPIPDYRPDLGPCWVWTAAPRDDGYGEIHTAGGGSPTVLAHRYSWWLAVGDIPEGMELDHLCRVRACVNPLHLEVVTHRENQRRGFGAAGVNARKTHCPRAHAYTPGNTYTKSDGSRRCRICTLESNRRSRQRRAA